MTTPSRVRRTCVFAILAAAVAGCQSADPAVKRSERTAGVFVSTRQSMHTGEQTIADSQASLRALQDATGDLRPAFEKFVAEVVAVREQAMQLRHDSEMVKAQAAAYCSARQNDVSTISNEEMRKLAEQRTAHVRQECDDIKDRYAKVDVAFDLYIRSLADLQTYLANELNYGSIRAGHKWFEESLVAGERLRGDVRALALKIELTSNMLSPVPIAITQWPTQLKNHDAVAERQ